MKDRTTTKLLLAPDGLQTPRAGAKALADFNRQRLKLLETLSPRLSQGRCYRVALVSPDSDIREALLHQLEGAEDLTPSACFKDAQAAIVSMLDERPDVILLDGQLPDMDGIDCVRALKTRLPQAQVLMLLPSDDGEFVFKALLAGASGYLTKDDAGLAVVSAVRDVIRGGAALNSFVATQVVQFLQKRGSGAPQSSAVTCLSERETEVLRQLGRGLAYKEIATELGISVETVRRHCHNIYEKLHVTGRNEAVAKFTSPQAA
jgi:DNA-binding NarL/FixJ family response regulator